MKIQLEKGNIRTSYVPYSINKKEISLNEPLRGLPNGIRDTIEKINGEWKIVRRCGEIIFNGEEDWILYDFNGETTSRYRLYLTTTDIAKKINSTGICDTIPVYLNSYWRQDFEMIENDGRRTIFCATIANVREWDYICKKTGDQIYCGSVVLSQNKSSTQLTLWSDSWAKYRNIFMEDGSVGQIIIGSGISRYDDWSKKNRLMSTGSSLFFKA